MPTADDTSATGLEAAVRDLIDREAIRDLASRYVDRVWHKDIDGVVALFDEDARFDTEEYPPVSGRAALADVFKIIFDTQDLEPWVHNHVVDLDGDTATGRCFLDLRMIRDGKRLFATGFYDDTYVRVDGAWRFARRKVTMRSFWPAARRKSAEPAGDGEGDE